jgi:hypothetical protein
MVASKKPLGWVATELLRSSSKYDPGAIVAGKTQTAVDPVWLTTVRGMLFKRTMGVAAPKLVPVMVNRDGY